MPPMLEWMTPKLAANVQLVLARARRISRAGRAPRPSPAPHASGRTERRGGDPPAGNHPSWVIAALGRAATMNSVSRQRWLARLSILLMAGALIVLVEFAGLHSLSLIGLHPARHLRDRRRGVLVRQESRRAALERVRDGGARARRGHGAVRQPEPALGGGRRDRDPAGRDDVRPGRDGVGHGRVPHPASARRPGQSAPS